VWVPIGRKQWFQKRGLNRLRCGWHRREGIFWPSKITDATNPSFDFVSTFAVQTFKLSSSTAYVVKEMDTHTVKAHNESESDKRVVYIVSQELAKVNSYTSDCIT
jgi:hypothetical protein